MIQSPGISAISRGGDVVEDNQVDVQLQHIELTPSFVDMQQYTQVNPIFYFFLNSLRVCEIQKIN